MRLLFVASRLHPNYTDALEQIALTSTVFILTTWTGDNERLGSLTKLQGDVGIWSRIKASLFRKIGLSEEQVRYRKRHPSILMIYRILKKNSINCILVRRDNKSLHRATQIAGRMANCSTITYRQDVLGDSTTGPHTNCIHPVVERASYTSSRRFIPLCIGVDRAQAAPRARPIRPSKTHKLRIVSTGKMVNRKGHHLLLMAIAELSEALPVSLKIYANYSQFHYERNRSYRKYLDNLIHENGLEQCVSFAPNVSPSGMLAKYAEADLFVHPGWVNAKADQESPAPSSMNGECGTRLYSLLEAMVVGLPVICCDDPLIYGAVKEGSNGLVFRCQDSTDLARKILDISTMDLEAMGQASRDIVRQHYSCVGFPERLRRAFIAQSLGESWRPRQ